MYARRQMPVMIFTGIDKDDCAMGINDAVSIAEEFFKKQEWRGFQLLWVKTTTTVFWKRVKGPCARPAIFYNTRDVKGMGWKKPEYPATVNHDELGNLGLSDNDEDALVAFMNTLSDGWTP